MVEETTTTFTCLCECHIGLIYPRNINTAYKKQCDHCNQKFTYEDLNKALHDVFDVQSRALINFIVLGDIAKAIKENRQPYAEVIELALPKNCVTYEVSSLFKTWNFTKTDYGYTYDFTPELKWTTKIPVRIYVYATKFKLFDNPNRVWGTTEGFFIPNPFEEYWKMRHLIKAKLEKGEPFSSQNLIIP